MNRKNIIFLLILNVIIVHAQTKQKIACVGNSITYGYGLASPATQSYPAQMQTMLGTTAWEVGNFGVSARTMLKKGDRPYWNESAYTNARAFLPNYVMIELGTNDAKTNNWNPYGKEFVSNYKEMITVFRNLQSKPEVWIGLIPPGQYVQWNIFFGYVRDSVNTRIKQVAIETGVGLIDIFDAFNGNASVWFSSVYLQPDSIHPKTAGATIIAQKVKEMITMVKPQISYTLGKLSVAEAYGYQWYYNGVKIPETEDGTKRVFTPAKTGKYKVQVKINPNNETRIVSYEYDLTELYSSVNLPDVSEFKVFPNPTPDGIISVESPYSNANKLSVSDNAGKLLLLKTDIDKKLDLSSLNSGHYILTLKINNEIYKTKLLKL